MTVKFQAAKNAKSKTEKQAVLNAKKKAIIKQKKIVKNAHKIVNHVSKKQENASFVMMAIMLTKLHTSVIKLLLRIVNNNLRMILVKIVCQIATLKMDNVFYVKRKLKIA